MHHQRLIATLMLAALPVLGASGASAQGLPSACVAAAEPATAPESGADTQGMDMDGAHHAGDETTEMASGMTQAATIADPDLAFNCGMIAHHQGAIAMAEAELKNGKDPASRKLAQAIIAAQREEIAEMTAWIVGYSQ